MANLQRNRRARLCCGAHPRFKAFPRFLGAAASPQPASDPQAAAAAAAPTTRSHFSDACPASSALLGDCPTFSRAD